MGSSARIREVRIEALAQGGDGIARPPGSPIVFVEGAAPGDLLRVEIGAPHRRLARGRVLEILEPGPDRREPPCPESGRCGGCGWQHLSDAAQAREVRSLLRTALRRTGGILPESVEVPPTLVPGTPLGYRRRARFLLDLAASPPRIGFRRRRSHDVLAMAACPVLEPELDELRARLAEALPRLAEALPDTRRAELQLDLPSPGRATARLSVREAVSHRALEAAATVIEAADTRLVAVRVASPGRSTGRGERVVRHRRGPEGAPSAFPAAHPPGAFLQASRAGEEALVSHVLASAAPSLKPGARVLELHAGSGTFTLPLAHSGARVTAVEEEADALEAARQALDDAALEAELVHGDAARAVEGLLAEGRRFDLCVLDPPRTGAKEVARRLPETGAERVVSISCDAATFARDAALLVAGGYRLERAQALLLFPQTPHFEIVGLLARE
jgi:23S rRNA (uracil1939-C5)-methyltransferase